MTEKARMGKDHQESACSKSSREPNTKRGITQLSTTDTRASTLSAQSQPGLRTVPAYRMQSQGGERTKAQQDGSLESLRMPETPRLGRSPQLLHTSYMEKNKQKKPHSTSSSWHASPTHQRAQTTGGELLPPCLAPATCRAPP